VSDQAPRQGGDFRERLANIPRLEDEPIHPPARPGPYEPQPYVVEPDPPSTEIVGGRRRRRWPIVLATILIVLCGALLLSLFRARQVFNSIERTEMAEVLSPGSELGTNILLVGTDSRDGIDANTDNAAGIIGGDVAIVGERTDTIMVLRLQDDGTAKFLSLPRDLWLPIDGGAPQRINTAVRGGPSALVNTVQRELAIPIAHYVQVDLVGFIALVDAVDGVQITIPHPAFDTRSGLNLPTAGPVVLDSTQALAYVRSRAYTERIDGQNVVDGTGDLGRVQRQQTFMRALLAKLTQQRNPVVLDSMSTALADAIVIDDATSMSDALGILNTVRSVTPESVTLPTRNATTSSGAAVLELTEDAAAVLAEFGG